jgi:hypothetical protein
MQALLYEQGMFQFPSSSLLVPPPVQPKAITAKFAAAATTKRGGAAITTKKPPTTVAPIPHTAHFPPLPFDSFAISFSFFNQPSARMRYIPRHPCSF